jgi:hypothetical protein
MADLGFDYNADDHKPLANFDPVPAGKYVALICESEVKTTRKGDGKYAWMKWVILEGEHEGRFVFDHCNIQNPNDKAVEIGMRQLRSICDALGKRGVRDTGELHDLPCVIDVRVKPASGDYPAGNEIKGYLPLEGTPAPAPAAPAPAAPANRPAPTYRGNGNTAPQPATAGAPGKPPWKR